ncbi:MAG: hypothetical protein ACE5OR_08405 [bacterium]
MSPKKEKPSFTLADGTRDTTSITSFNSVPTHNFHAARELYGLAKLVPNVEHSSDNTTIFVTLPRDPIDPDPDKEQVVPSLIFSTRNIPAGHRPSCGKRKLRRIQRIRKHGTTIWDISQTEKAYKLDP